MRSFSVLYGSIRCTACLCARFITLQNNINTISVHSKVREFCIILKFYCTQLKQYYSNWMSKNKLKCNAIALFVYEVRFSHVSRSELLIRSKIDRCCIEFRADDRVLLMWLLVWGFEAVGRRWFFNGVREMPENIFIRFYRKTRQIKYILIHPSILCEQYRKFLFHKKKFVRSIYFH